MLLLSYDCFWQWWWSLVSSAVYSCLSDHRVEYLDHFGLLLGLEKDRVDGFVHDDRIGSQGCDRCLDTS